MVQAGSYSLHGSSTRVLPHLPPHLRRYMVATPTETTPTPTPTTPTHPTPATPAVSPGMALGAAASIRAAARRRSGGNGHGGSGNGRTAAMQAAEAREFHEGPGLELDLTAADVGGWLAWNAGLLLAACCYPSPALVLLGAACIGLRAAMHWHWCTLDAFAPHRVPQALC